MVGEQGQETVWMADDVDNSGGPNEGPSKKKRREEEDMHYVGGIRNPAKAVSRLTKLAEAGKDIRRLWTRLLLQSIPKRLRQQQSTVNLMNER